MRYFVFVLTAAFIVSPAFAADGNSITVIGDDGKKTTIQLEDTPDMVLPGEEQFDMPARESERAEPIEETTRAPEPPEPKPAAEPRVPELKQKQYVDPIVAPEGRAEVNPAAEKPAKKESKKDSGKKSKKKKGEPVPPRAPTQKEVQKSLAPGGVITERAASSIAMDVAPPSSGFTTARQSYEGKDAYVVTFKTESGPYDVIVDAATGAVLLHAYVETEKTEPTQPGHLPSSWEPFDPQPVGRPDTKK